VLGRYLLVGFADDHALEGGQAMVIADGFVSMLQLAGMAMMLAIRAALIPSTPRRTILVTATYGVPMLVVTSLLVPLADGGLALRALDSGAYPWLPGTTAMIWGFAVITCAVITRAIYGLRAEVREARRLGQYVLEDKLGEGGMGEVYRARHGMMRRPSAIKLLRIDRAGEHDLLRFEREVQLTARLTHPNTITIFDYGRAADGAFYYAMELLDGATLEQIVALDGPQEAGRVVRILSMACGALSEAHSIGLIHRDIKPANIMLCRQGGEHDVVKMLDFGLVKEIEVDEGVKLTGASAITGTRNTWRRSPSAPPIPWTPVPTGRRHASRLTGSYHRCWSSRPSLSSRASTGGPRVTRARLAGAGTRDRAARARRFRTTRTAAPGTTPRGCTPPESLQSPRATTSTAPGTHRTGPGPERRPAGSSHAPEVAVFPEIGPRKWAKGRCVRRSVRP
jgi:hypothetical protein